MNKYWQTFPPVHVSLSRLNRALLTSEDSPSEKKKGFTEFMADYGARING